MLSTEKRIYCYLHQDKDEWGEWRMKKEMTFKPRIFTYAFAWYVLLRILFA
jgi:hypothetical protein